MKTRILFLLISFSGFAQTRTDLLKIKELLLENFPENVQFINKYNSEEIPADTLYFRFYHPEIEITNDTLFVSYVVEHESWENDLPVFEKFESKTALKDVSEFYGFEFTFGNYDRFVPNLYYWNVVNESAEIESYAIPEAQFYKGPPFTGLELKFTDKRSIWFPTKEMSNKELEKLFRKILRANRKLRN